MEEMATDLSESSLVTAIESNLFALFPLFEYWADAEFHDTPELMWSITDIPHSWFNSVLRARVTPKNAADYINAAIARCQSRNVPMLWWTGPSTEPPDLGSRLSGRGFQAVEARGMAADLNSLPEKLELPKGTAIKRVESAEALEIWCRILCTAFEWPDFVAGAYFDLNMSLGFDAHFPYRNYLGYLEDEAVATSSLFLGAGVAGIYNVGTLEHVRRRGIGAAMTAVPLVEARSLGYRIGILHSAESGFNVYRSLGFAEYCKIHWHVWPGE